MNVYYVTIALTLCLAAASQRLWRASGSGSQPPSDAAARVRPGPASHVLAVMAGSLLVAVGALRWRVGTDYPNYAQLYPAYSTESWREYTVLNEPGLKLIALVSRHVRDDYATMLGIAAAVTIGLSVWTLHKYSPSFPLAVFLFCVTGPWLGSFNGVRQYIACAIIFAGHGAIHNRQFGRYLMVIVTATLFHVSAVVGLLFYFLPRRRLTIATAAIALCAAAVATEGYGRLLEVFMAIRSDAEFGGAHSYFVEELNPLRVLVAIAPIAFYALFAGKSTLSKRDHFYVHMLLVHAALLFASSGSAYIARFSLYTGMFLCVALPRLMPTNRGPWRALLVTALCLMYTVFWYVETVNIPELANFRWIFERQEAQ